MQMQWRMGESAIIHKCEERLTVYGDNDHLDDIINSTSSNKTCRQIIGYIIMYGIQTLTFSSLLNKKPP
ncbi:hypothetical protein CISIN_1g042293mg [Citrus sinensis]|uniref:Uncharacterized protein n=1 Tax=Citrus sinensis TaxID=2711 RepID=A0A067FNT2_CITSI|nr:hypothetical protein CISIN_1g042293mg [Citrus sinensis]